MNAIEVEDREDVAAITWARSLRLSEDVAVALEDVIAAVGAIVEDCYHCGDKDNEFVVILVPGVVPQGYGCTVVSVTHGVDSLEVSRHPDPMAVVYGLRRWSAESTEAAS